MAFVDIPRTLGSLLIGGLFAAVLSGAVIGQTLIYFKLYPNDIRSLRVLVSAVWVLDMVHSGLIWVSLWDYIIHFYGETPQLDSIPITLALSIQFTAILTLLVHSFFAQRIYKLSKRNWYLTIPVLVIALLRVVAATGTTIVMLHYRTFSAFRAHATWLFTLGLSLSSAVDILVTSSLSFLLQTSKSDLGQFNDIIDSLILYTFETGSLTCATTIVSMLCWLVTPNDLVFMGLHFVIGKLYANSLLVTLNTRRNLRNRHGGSSGTPKFVVHDRHNNSSAELTNLGSPKKNTELQINVERSVEYTVETAVHFDRGGNSRSSGYLGSTQREQGVHWTAPENMG